VSEGRYTITEIEFANARWRNPSNHALPAMVKATDLGSVHPYLKTVTMLQPRGNLPAEVVAAVARLAGPRRRWPRVLAAALMATLLAGGSPRATDGAAELDGEEALRELHLGAVAPLAARGRALRARFRSRLRQRPPWRPPHP